MAEPLKRLTDWVERFDRYFRACRVKDFGYGSHDCCIFAAGAVEAITGVTLAADLRDYEGREQADAILYRFGGLAAMVESMMLDAGAVPLACPRCAKRGSVIILRIGEVDYCGIIGLDGRPWTVTEKRLGMFRSSQIVAAWGYE